MDFLELSHVRFSVLEYENRPVEQEKLDRIIEAGIAAPTDLIASTVLGSWIGCIIQRLQRQLCDGTRRRRSQPARLLHRNLMGRSTHHQEKNA